MMDDMYLLHLVYNTHIITAQMIYVFGILLQINIEVRKWSYP